jgi:hypothetical protein
MSRSAMPRGPRPNPSDLPPVFTPAEAVVRNPAPPARRDLGRRKPSQSAPIKVPGDKREIPHIDTIAGAVLVARDSWRRPSRARVPRSPQPAAPIRAFAPTTGVVRAASSSATAASVNETTLTLNLDELRRAHSRMGARRWWFPFGRR